LQSLDELKHLCLKDAQYGSNPVNYLCNYSLYVLFHLPGLLTLDTLNVSPKYFKELAEVRKTLRLAFWMLQVTAFEYLSL
jgi:hypothetical protein